MKPVDFALAVPEGLDAAGRLLAGEGARAMGGGQSLGPMLNLRAARPSVVVPLAGLAGLQGVEETAQAITIGAAVTHAAVADGRTADLDGAILAGVARGIAYRAVRNRGTIGGSLCHADPAADWLTTLSALDAVVLTARLQGGRALALGDFVTGPYRTALETGEIVRAVRVPRPGVGARWAYHKLCRKPGEFAHAMAAVLRDGARVRLAIGAVGGPPIVLVDGAVTLAGAEAALGFMEVVPRAIQMEAVARALAGVGL